MIPSILILILHVHVYHINSVFINYTERCPGDNLERILRATAWCSTIEEYHCLYDEDFHLAEICQNYKQIPKGKFPRYSSFGDDIYYDSCPETRYQHWPAKSFQITDCLFEKSKCVSEGQKLCTTGTASTDSTCECDYKNGYAMIGGKCCSPTSYEDCTCFRKDCPDENQELDPDYNCVNKCASGFDRREGDLYCTVKLHTSMDIETTSPTTPAFDGDFISENPHNGTAKIFLYVGLGLYCLHILFILIYGCVNRIWRPFRYKLIPYSVWCVFTIPCLILGWHFISERKTVAIILSVLLVLLICFYCLLIYVLGTHQIRKERKVYNEEYDVRIFRLLMAASNKGDMEKLRGLQNEQYIDMEDTDYDKRSALHLAAVTGNVEAVDFLLKKHFCFPDARDRWKRTVLDDINWHRENKFSEDLKDTYNEIEGKLKKYKKSSVQKTEKNHFRANKALELIKAAEKGDLDTVKRLKNLGTDMNLSNSMGQTALHAAAENGMEDIVKYLLDDCEVSSFVRMNLSDQRPIDVVPSDKKEVNNRIREMLQKDMDKAPTKEVKKMEPLDDNLKIVRLLNAASRGDIKQMRSYYEAGYDMTAADYDNRTALHIAVSDNQDHIIRFLLEECELHEIAKEGKDRWDTTPLSASRERGRESVHYVFLELCPKLVDTENDQYRTHLLLYAGADGDIHTLRRLSEKNVDMDLRDYDGRTALHLAAAENKLQAVEYLVNTAGVKISIPDRDNRKPVDEAVAYRDKEKYKTDNKEKDKTDNEEIIRILKKDILKEAGRKEKPQETQSTLCELPKAEQIKLMVMQAAVKGDLDTLKHKQFKNISMDSCSDYFKNRPLHVCAAKAKIDVVQYLINEKKVSPFVRNSFWKTPLQLVQDKIDYWEKRKSSRQQDFIAIKTFLEEAMESSFSGEVEVDDNFEKHEIDKKEKISLFLYKAYEGDIKAVRRYLKTDPELLNEYDYDERTALHLAAAEGHIELVKFIVKQEDVDKGKKDRWGETPLDEAEKKGDKEIIDILQS